MSTAIKAINSKHQKALTKCYVLYRKYHNLVNMADVVDSRQQLAANERKQAQTWESFSEIFDNLPKSEQGAFLRQHKEIHGYA